MNRIKLIGLLAIIIVSTPSFSLFATNEEKTMETEQFNEMISEFDKFSDEVIVENENNLDIKVRSNKKSTETLIAEYYDKIDKATYEGYKLMVVLTEEQEIQADYQTYLGEQKIRNSKTSIANYQVGAISWASRAGNTLYTPESKSYKIIKHGHTALISNVTNYVIEATTTVSNGAKVFHWNYSNLWKVGQFKQVYELYPLFMDSGKSWSVNYALKQVNKPYAITKDDWWDGPWVPCSDASSWYCSKLVYMAYRWGGRYDLLAYSRGAGEIHSGAFLVTPKMIYLSRNMGVYKYIGNKNVVTYK